MTRPLRAWGMVSPSPLLVLLLLLLLLLGTAPRCMAAAPATRPATRPAAADVVLADVEGRPVRPLNLPAGRRGVILFFVLHDCPNSNAYAPEIARVCREYDPKGFDSFLVYAERDVEADVLRAHAKEYAYPCPALVDRDHALVRRFGVSVAPEVVVVAAAGDEATYMGRIDDRYPELGVKRPHPTTHDLRDALDDLLAGRNVRQPRTKAIGCSVQ